MSYLGRLFEASEEENRRVILKRVAPYGPFDSLLDLGCHDGDFTMRLAAAGGVARPLGVELLEPHAAAARARGVEVTVADLEDRLPFEDGTFDLVHANQVIEHVRGTDLLLREARRVCTDDGIVVISTNNLSSWHNVLMLALGLQPMPIHVSDEVHVGNPMNLRAGELHRDAGQTHLRLFTSRALVELAGFHGLDLLQLRASGYYPLPSGVARLMARADRRHAAFLVGLFRPARGFQPRRGVRAGTG